MPTTAHLYDMAGMRHYRWDLRRTVYRIAVIEIRGSAVVFARDHPQQGARAMVRLDLGQPCGKGPIPAHPVLCAVLLDDGGLGGASRRVDMLADPAHAKIDLIGRCLEFRVQVACSEIDVRDAEQPFVIHSVRAVV